MIGIKYAMLLLSLLICGVCYSNDGLSEEWKKKVSDPALIHKVLKKVTDIIVYDVFSPPVASRTYAYVSLAGYEAMLEKYPDGSFAGKLNGLGPIKISKSAQGQVHEIAAVQAMLMVAKAMVVSEDSVQQYREQLIRDIKSLGIPAELLNNSIAYGTEVAKHILSWASKDQYKETRSYPRFNLSMDESVWKPTPPAYMKAIEPHWNRMRPFLLDSAQQFKPLTSVPFSIDQQSQFYNDALEVFQQSGSLTKEQKEIASFWDCNPFKVNQNGHVMTASKKISPGGHWVNITALACKKAGKNSLESLKAYTMVSMVLADAFISCWDEKYRSLVIRPETYINQYIDQSWMPLLQTPPFPEYPSGHSVASSAAAVVLTALFGDNFQYSDDTEVEFGLPVRSYTSFEQAANEAAISRLYGGIHYRPAIENGQTEGRDLANFGLRKMGYHLLAAQD